MPVFDYGRFIYGGIKITLFSIFLSFFYSSLTDYSSIINVFIDGALGQLSSLTSLDLGCFLSGVGGVDFLNAIINQLYIVGSLLISALGSVLTTKFVIRFVGFIMGV